MKNWPKNLIIALCVLILPMITYFVLDKTNADNASFEAIAASGKPTVIKFSSQMCLDCKKLEATVNAVMPAYEDKVAYESINVQSNDKKVNQLIKKYNVTLVPTCVFLNKDGSTYKRTEGFLDKEEFEKYLKAIING